MCSIVSSVLEQMQHLYHSSDMVIEPLKYYFNGTSLYAFDLTPDQNDGSHFALIREGKLSLEREIESNVCCIVGTVIPVYQPNP